jgi:hypothetical protein
MKTKPSLPRPTFALLALLVLPGCADEPWPRPAAVALDQFTAEHAEWQENRRAGLVRPPSGPVLWIGLWELPQGPAQAGSDSALAIVLPAEDAPALAGTFVREGQDVRFEPAPGPAVLLADGTPLTEPMALASDRTASPTDLAVGSVRLRVHGEPGTDRLWVRAYDVEHPLIETFALPETFPLDTLWRVAARFEPYPEPRDMEVADVLQGTIVYQAPGELVFEIDGVEHRLTPTATPTSRDYFILMWDSTADATTYQAGRYLRAPFPDETGWTVIDFNRAYNPPCVFSPFSVCALPPRENRLQVPITAGEMRAH